MRDILNAILIAACLSVTFYSFGQAVARINQVETVVLTVE
jgi:hypothetical protein